MIKMKFTPPLLKTFGAVGAGALLLTLSGCGEDLSDRPYVMSCGGNNLISYGKSARAGEGYATRLAGMDMPDLDKLAGDLRLPAFTEKGYMPEETGLKGNRSTVPLSIDGTPLVEDTSLTVMDGGLYSSSQTRPITGMMSVTHYYLTRDGELKEVEGFHVASMGEGGRGPDGYHNFRRDVATTLPSDAAYAVYYIEGERWGSTRKPDGSPKVAGRGESGYWVAPLNKNQRYQPYDDTKGVPPNRTLGPYAGDPRYGLKIGEQVFTVDDPMTRQHRRANEDVETVPCFVRPGSTMEFVDFYDTGRPTNDESRFRGRTDGGRHGHGRLGIYFVGSEEDVLDLPRNPKNFSKG